MGRIKNSTKLINSTSDLHTTSEDCGLGVDIIDISRFREILKRTPSFEKRMFSKSEISYCDKMNDKAPHLAARFAAKEAVLKSLGRGFSDGIGYRDIEVALERSNKPTIKLSGRVAEIAEAEDIENISISLSHTSNDAICCALAIYKNCRPHKKTEPVDALVTEFKKMRNALNEI